MVSETIQFWLTFQNFKKSLGDAFGLLVGEDKTFTLSDVVGIKLTNRKDDQL